MKNNKNKKIFNHLNWLTMVTLGTIVNIGFLELTPVLAWDQTSLFSDNSKNVLIYSTRLNLNRYMVQKNRPFNTNQHIAESPSAPETPTPTPKIKTFRLPDDRSNYGNGFIVLSNIGVALIGQDNGDISVTINLNITSNGLRNPTARERGPQPSVILELKTGENDPPFKTYNMSLTPISCGQTISETLATYIDYPKGLFDSIKAVNLKINPNGRFYGC